MRPRPTALPTLETERLLLRAMEPDDAPALFAIYGDPEVMRYASDEPFADLDTVTVMLRSVAQLLARGESLEWAVVEQATGQVVGTCGLHSFDEAAHAAEVGCMLARAAWGRGIMQEALLALFAYGQSALGIRTLRAEIDAPNLRSVRLFTRLGFAHRHNTIYERELAQRDSAASPMRSPMAQVLKPPSPLPARASEPTVFLAGSIEMGRASQWQRSVEAVLDPYPLTIFNPRRDDWDATWEQSAANPQFVGQVQWELDAQERADRIAMYFAPDTKAPITLLELGLFATSGKLLVCCPTGYWRKGNVDVVCTRYGIPQVPTLEALCQALVAWAEQRPK